MLTPILYYPSPALREKCDPIEKFGNDYLNEIAVRLADTMVGNSGAGLAGPQIGIMARVIAVMREDRKSAFVLVNPVITEASKKTDRHEEGCLSFPHPKVVAKVERPSKVTVSYRDLIGEEKTVEAKGMLARALQHEIDHLDGMLFIDRIGSVKLSLIRPYLRELEEQFGDRKAAPRNKSKRNKRGKRRKTPRKQYFR
jgi:peptide deformylase